LKFASEGYLPTAVVAAVAVAVVLVFGPAVAVVPAVLAVAVLLFFRDPERHPQGGPNAIVAPADGRVVAISLDRDGHALHRGSLRRISIFMSPLDVHINRTPTDVTVEEVSYSRGKFRAAYADDASDVNESNAILMRSDGGARIVVVQIAGWLARRIICHVGVGDHLRRGQKFGLIMFGSRVDVYLPEDVTIKVERGQRVSAGSTVIAEFASDGQNV